MTTPEMKITTTEGTVYFGWYSKHEDTVQEFIEKIVEAPSGTIVELHSEFEVDDQKIEKSLFVTIEQIVAVRKTHEEYMEELEE